MTIVDHRGGTLELEEVARRMSAADVAFIGEMHGHPAGLDLARRIFERVAETSARAALSLEFIERDQQAALDAFAAGEIDEAELVKRRGSLLPKPHMAMIERARARKLPVVGANAPRRLAKLARIEGWDALRALPEAERALFVIPDAMPSDAYRSRFAAAMGMSDPGEGAHGPGDGGKLDGFYRAQVLWDATMADSVGKLLDARRAPVVHVVGKFHVERDGGLVELVRRAHPSARVVTLVIAEEPSDEAQGAGDIVAFVGKAPPHHP